MSVWKRNAVIRVALCLTLAGGLAPLSTAGAEPLLDREVVELSLSSVPIARLSCTLTAYRKNSDGDDQQAESKTVEWAPGGRQPLTRRIRVRGGAEWAIQCGSEPFMIGTSVPPEAVATFPPSSVGTTTAPPVTLPPSSLGTATVPLVYSLWREKSSSSGSKFQVFYRVRGERLLEAEKKVEGKRVRGERLLEAEKKVEGSSLPAEDGSSPQRLEVGQTAEDRTSRRFRVILENATLPLSSPVGSFERDSEADAIGKYTANKNVPSGINPADFPSLFVSIRKLDKLSVSAGDDGSTIASNRSVVPFDQLLGDLATAAAEVAVTRARNHATEFIRESLAEVFCELLTIERVRERSPTGQLSKWLPPERNGPLLPLTCQAVRGVRVAEMAATGLALRRALTRDLTNIAFLSLAMLEGLQSAPELRQAIESVARVTTALMTSNAEVIERQVQSMLLYLASETGAIGDPSDSWRDPLLVGTAILTECMQQSECSADQLQRLLLDEIQDDGSAAKAIQRWSDLPDLLARMREVLRPAPGTPLAETVGRALNIALDVLERAGHESVLPKADFKKLETHFTLLSSSAIKVTLMSASKLRSLALDEGFAELKKKCGASSFKKGDSLFDALENAFGSALNANQCTEIVAAMSDANAEADARLGVSQRISLLRSLVNASVDQKYGAAMQLAGALFSDLVAHDCKSVYAKGTKCEVAVTGPNIEKWFGVLGAFTSYAASYDAKPGEDASASEIAKFRAEERKKAMNELIDAATDRSGRGRDRVVSLGVMVGFSGGLAHLYRSDACKNADTCAIKESQREWTTGLSLPTGFAYQLLPNGHGFWRKWGIHAQLSFVDIGRFLTTSDGSIATPKPTTPLYYSGQAGVLLGGPKYNAAILFDAGYAPGLDYGNKDLATGGFRAGIIAGMYVPFLDFN